MHLNKSTCQFHSFEKLKHLKKTAYVIDLKKKLNNKILLHKSSRFFKNCFALTIFTLTLKLKVNNQLFIL